MNRKILLLVLFFPVLLLNAQCFTNAVSSEGTIILRKSDGTLWARGDNNTGLVGNGTTEDVVELIQIGSDSDWSNEFCAVQDRAYAIKQNGTLWYWGGIINPLLPTQIGTDTDWLKVNASSYAVAAIKSNGTLWTMGKNSNGVLGIGNSDDNYTVNNPIQVGSDNDWKLIFSGANNFYALKTNNTLWSWGSELALGYQVTTNSDYSFPHQIGEDTWKTIAGCFGKTFGIKTDGALYGWGYDLQHLISSNDYNFIPIQIGTDTDWKLIDPAQNFVIGLKENHTRWGWGSNWQYNLGTGNITDISQPTQLDSARDWEMINIDVNGTGHPSGIKQDGAHYIWKSIWPPLNNGVYQFPTPTVIFQSCTLPTTNFDDELFKIHPNPLTNFSTMTFNEIQENTILNIFDLTGKKVMTDTCTGILYTLAKGNLKPGLYIIQLIDAAKKTTTKKLIIQ
ncbi:MAG: T9SS type A sorting domain-containing protein [Flavobacteriaceae bacterium]|nr:T9SS type A sorting domain-containing protein [Bacteroidota bacterium]